MTALLDMIHAILGVADPTGFGVEGPIGLEFADPTGLEVNNVPDLLASLDLDLSNYSVEEISDALDFALDATPHPVTCTSDLTDLPGLHYGHGHDISFGNSYDDRTGEFISMMESKHVNIPPSVDHTYADSNTVTLDRHSAGGMTSIDKSICRTSIENAYNNGQITKSEMDDLLDKMRSC